MKNLILALLAAPLVGCGPAYETNFSGLDLSCCIVHDSLHTPPGQAMLEGHSDLPGETSKLNDPGNGMLEMVAAAPPSGTVAAGLAGTIGVYSTQLSFGPNGPGQAYLISATLQRPTRTLSPNAWSILLIMREPETPHDDLNGARIQLSMRTVQSPPLSQNLRSVELRVQEMTDADHTTKLPGSIELSGTPALQDIEASKPFTMTLIINRQKGTGTAFLSTESQTLQIPEFKMNLFTNNPNDPVIHTVGASLANTDPDNVASVELSHFEIQTN